MREDEKWQRRERKDESRKRERVFLRQLQLRTISSQRRFQKGQHRDDATTEKMHPIAAGPNWNKSSHRKHLKKVKVCSYIAQYPVHWTAQSALHFTPGRPVHSDTSSTSL